MLEDKNVSKTSLAEIGEFGLINQIKEGFPIKLESSIKGIGDRCADQWRLGQSLQHSMPESGIVHLR